MSGDDSGDPLVTYVYNNSWPMADALVTWLDERQVLPWPYRDTHAFVPVTRTLAVKDNSENFSGGP